MFTRTILNVGHAPLPVVLPQIDPIWPKSGREFQEGIVIANPKGIYGKAKGSAKTQCNDFEYLWTTVLDFYPFHYWKKSDRSLWQNGFALTT